MEWIVKILKNFWNKYKWRIINDVCIIFLCLYAFMFFSNRKSKTTVQTVIKTVHDTIIISNPIAVSHKTDTVNKVKIVYREIKDTLETHDTIEKIISLPREYITYKDSTYKAVVSGVQPRLENLELYQKTIYKTQTETVTLKDDRQFGIGIQGGYTFDGTKFKPYVGVGFSWNIIRFRLRFNK